MEERIYECIKNSDFKEAKELCEGMTLQELGDVLEILVWKEQNVGVYFFVLYLIGENECAELHNIASDLLFGCLCFVNGAYWVSYQHMKKALLLQPENITYKESLLFYYDIPDKILSRESAIEIINQIFQKDPWNETATNVLREIEEDDRRRNRTNRTKRTKRTKRKSK